MRKTRISMPNVYFYFNFSINTAVEAEWFEGCVLVRFIPRLSHLPSFIHYVLLTMNGNTKAFLTKR